MYFTGFLVSSLLLLPSQKFKKVEAKNLSSSEIKINQFHIFFLIFRTIKIEKIREIQFHEIFASFLKID